MKVFVVLAALMAICAAKSSSTTRPISKYDIGQNQEVNGGYWGLWNREFLPVQQYQPWTQSNFAQFNPWLQATIQRKIQTEGSIKQLIEPLVEEVLVICQQRNILIKDLFQTRKIVEEIIGQYLQTAEIKGQNILLPQIQLAAVREAVLFLSQSPVKPFQFQGVKSLAIQIAQKLFLGLQGKGIFVPEYVQLNVVGAIERVLEQATLLGQDVFSIDVRTRALYAGEQVLEEIYKQGSALTGYKGLWGLKDVTPVQKYYGSSWNVPTGRPVSQAGLYSIKGDWTQGYGGVWPKVWGYQGQQQYWV